MFHFAGKAVKVLTFTVLSTVLLTGFTLAADSDIAVAVGSFDQRIISAMESAGYLYRPDHDNGKHMLFVKADGD